jgi:hypothetical protein
LLGWRARLAQSQAGSWKKTGGKVQSSRTRHGKGRAARALRLAAWSLVRSKSYLRAYLRRQRSRLGAPKAITAADHKLARIVYNLMRYGVAYAQPTEAAYAEHVRERLEKQLRRRARKLGFDLQPIAPPASPALDQFPGVGPVRVARHGRVRFVEVEEGNGVQQA